MSAIVDSINPKVIISFIDNSLIMGQLDSIFPYKLVIAIQNGTRMSTGGFLNGNPNFMLPHYFSFGEYEKDVIKRYHIKCKEIYNIGNGERTSSSLYLIMLQFIQKKIANGVFY